jgi:hypothetical protein
MEKEFIPYEQALALKQLGFDYQCVNYYSHYGNGQVKLNNLVLCSKIGVETNRDKGILAPLYQQAFRWFREKYEYYYHIFPLQITASDKAGYRYSWEIYNHTPDWITEDRSLLGSLTYEEAELACLIKLIEICSELK